MSKETSRAFKDLKYVTQSLKGDRRAKATEDFPVAENAAWAAGLTLRRCSDTHYQLRGPKSDPWLIQIYPGNCRIFNPPSANRGPYLDLPSPWSLMDAVDAARNAKSQAEGGAA